MRSPDARGVLPTFLLAFGVAAASAEDVVLRPAYKPGDSYLLLLSTHTDTRASSSEGAVGSFSEDVQLDYGAHVVVLAVDGEGRPVRERHEDVRLTYERPGESGSLFKEGASFEVRREAGELRLFSGERRLSARIENVVADLLARQLEHDRLPELLEPGRPVDVGESWPLDRGRARRHLLERGVRMLGAAESGRAGLEEDPPGEGDGDLVVRYRIPLASFELERMPPSVYATQSEGRVEGFVRIPAHPRRDPLLHRAELELKIDGIVRDPSAEQPLLWTLQSSKRWDQRTLRMGRHQE